MKLWGWWRKEEAPEPSQEPSQQPQMLDDLPPKFEDNSAKIAQAQELSRPSLSQMLKRLDVNDFKTVNQVPCFRNAMLTGMGIGLTAGSVIFVSRRSLSRASNWAFGGFVVGAVVSWEQCRFRMLRGKRNIQHAKGVWKNKDEKELESKDTVT